ncbi:MAG: cupin domain-containing protein [Roseibium sp.]|uniref:cupin domain-containing protein n=1 Tax=Roseibium sp. TaxID=1936156 RepID=UPI002605144F|nr:cupin domain-containing protein [Roseibium sp.]MCV0428417.1 cupin domain-containing protein [Roseibium sp.]
MLGTTDKEFAQTNDRWFSRVVSEVVDQSDQLAKLNGKFVWHDHKNEVEFYLVQESLTICCRARDNVVLRTGDRHVVPKSLEHRSIAAEESWMMPFDGSETKYRRANYRVGSATLHPLQTACSSDA